MYVMHLKMLINNTCMLSGKKAVKQWKKSNNLKLAISHEKRLDYIRKTNNYYQWYCNFNLSTY